MTQTKVLKARCLRILNQGLVICLLALFIFQLCSCIMKYHKAPTYTITSVVDQEKTNFPAFTFCSHYPYSARKLWVRVRNVSQINKV